MRNGMIIIDADGHALDQESMYRQRLPEQFRRRQSIGGGGDGFDRRQNGHIPYPPVTVERYLQDADLEGIDVMVLYPTGGLGYTRLREHDYSILVITDSVDLARHRSSSQTPVNAPAHDRRSVCRADARLDRLAQRLGALSPATMASRATA